jgi:hypothetical protein
MTTTIFSQAFLKKIPCNTCCVLKEKNWVLSTLQYEKVYQIRHLQQNEVNSLA